MTNNTQLLQEKALSKWAKVLESKEAPKFSSRDAKIRTAILLENQAKQLRQDRQMLNEDAPTNITGGVAKWDPVLIAMVRRTAPSLIANDVVGVQPMTGPTGLAFAMKSRYTAQNGVEALGLNEPNSAFSGAGTQNVNDIFATTGSPPVHTLDHGTGVATATGEGDITKKMAFSVDKISVTAQTRALATEWSDELSQDMQAMHSMDPETILADILSTELVSEMNRELIRTLYTVAKPGAQEYTNTSGVIDVNTDSDGRWFVEKFKGLMLHLNFEANKIFTETRRGRGNFIIVSQNVATALGESGKLDYNSAISDGTGVNNDIANSTYAGVLNGQFKVYIDPYMVGDFAVVGFKGNTELDAGLFYCPYVPFYVRKTIDEHSFQPKMAFKTRYGVVANPFVEKLTNGLPNGTPDGSDLTRDINPYYRKVKISNLI
jgi:hypothetical protein